MDKIIAKLKQEPVRAYLYSILVIVLGILVQQGVVTASDTTLIETIAATVLGVGAVEKVRSKVKPSE